MGAAKTPVIIELLFRLFILPPIKFKELELNPVSEITTPVLALLKLHEIAATVSGFNLCFFSVILLLFSKTFENIGLDINNGAIAKRIFTILNIFIMIGLRWLGV